LMGWKSQDYETGTFFTFFSFPPFGIVCGQADQPRRLVKIINDYSLQTSLSQGCVEVLKADVIGLNKRLYSDQRGVIRVDQYTVDHTTQSTVLGCQNNKYFVVFVCRHTYYEQDLVKLMGTFVFSFHLCTFF